MKKLLTALFLVALLVASSSTQAQVAFTVDTSRTPTVGEPFILEIYANNSHGAITGISASFEITVTGSAGVNHYSLADSMATWDVYIPVGASGDSIWADTSLALFNGWADLWSVLTNWAAWSWDATSPDTINFTGAALFSSWTEDADYTKYIGLAFEPFNGGGQICIAAVDHFNDTYDWLFDGNPTVTFGPIGSQEEVPGEDQPASTPVCYTIEGGNDVSENIKDGLPTEFDLGQNYPNPFNMSTLIEFALPQQSDVAISIYNILGQKVTTLVDMEMDAGYHAVDWDGTSENGTEVGSGIYFYKIETDGFKDTKKLMLLK